MRYLCFGSPGGNSIQSRTSVIQSKFFMKRYSPLCVLFFCFAVLVSCSKNNEAGSVDNFYKLSYGDSVFYVNSQPANIINPVNAPQGTYYSIPKGLEIDPNTGSINISASEAGLRYKVTFTSTTGYSSSS